MTTKNTNLAWIDLEMTGLIPARNKIIEIAMIITNKDLEILAQSEVVAIHQADSILDNMDNWNKSTHAKTGLIERVKASNIDEEQAENIMLEFIKKWIPKNSSPMCGNTVHQDRRFMQLYMPKLEEYFHYRNVDVSTLKELAKLWNPNVYNGIKKKGAHQALEDIKESIDEMIYYKNNFLRLEI